VHLAGHQSEESDVFLLVADMVNEKLTGREPYAR
jgi:hypothetical protein